MKQEAINSKARGGSINRACHSTQPQGREQQETYGALRSHSVQLLTMGEDLCEPTQGGTRNHKHHDACCPFSIREAGCCLYTFTEDSYLGLGTTLAAQVTAASSFWLREASPLRDQGTASNLKPRDQQCCQAVVVCFFNPSTSEAEAG